MNTNKLISDLRNIAKITKSENAYFFQDKVFASNENFAYIAHCDIWTDKTHCVNIKKMLDFFLSNNNKASIKFENNSCVISSSLGEMILSNEEENNLPEFPSVVNPKFLDNIAIEDFNTIKDAKFKGSKNSFIFYNNITLNSGEVICKRTRIQSKYHRRAFSIPCDCSSFFETLIYADAWKAQDQNNNDILVITDPQGNSIIFKNYTFLNENFEALFDQRKDSFSMLKKELVNLVKLSSNVNKSMVKISLSDAICQIKAANFDQNASSTYHLNCMPLINSKNGNYSFFVNPSKLLQALDMVSGNVITLYPSHDSTNLIINRDAVILTYEPPTTDNVKSEYMNSVDKALVTTDY